MTYKRKTKTIWVIESNYGYGHGWEEENTEETRADGLRSLKEYRENGPGQYRLKVRREKIEQKIEQPLTNVIWPV